MNPPRDEPTTERVTELEQEPAAIQAARVDDALSGARWRNLMQRSPFGIVVYGPDGRVKTANPAMRQLFELSEAETDFVIAHYNVLQDPQLEERGQTEFVRRAFAGEPSTLPCILYEAETPIEGRTVRKWLEGAIYPILDVEGRVQEVVIMHADVTRLVETREELRRSKDVLGDRLSELEQLYAHTPVGLCLLDTGLRFLRINETLAAIHGPPVEQHLGRTLREVLPRIAPEIEHVYRRVIETGQPTLDYEVRGATQAEPAGERDFLVSHHPLKAEDGRVRGISTVVQDITERKRAMEALRRSEERFREIAENLREVFWVFDCVQRKVTYISPAWETVWGRSAESVYDDPDTWGESVHPDDRAIALETLARITETKEPQTCEYRIVRPDGEVRWILDRGVAICDEAGGVVRVVGIAEDVTERKAAEEERRRLEAQVQHGQKLESLGVLAGGIAHDFNNLLVAVLGNADLALARLPPESPGRDYLDRIKAAAQRASELTNQMLAYSGKGHFVVEPIDLNRLVEEMGHLLQTVISKKARLGFDLAVDLPSIEADASQIRQIVMNLITNASEAIGNTAGTIRLRTGVVEADEAYLSGSFVDGGLATGSYVCLEVTDSGAGMDPETRRQIFDPFFTTKFTGRGLGLAAVLGIVRGHRGAIRVESAAGSGSTFTLLLPPSGPSPPKRRGQATSRNGVGQAEVTVLVVDDEDAVRRVSRAMLESAGFRVLTAADGAEAVELFRGRQDEISLVLLDMTMPRLDGEETLRRMREIRSDLRIVLSSGYSEYDATERFAGLELAGFLQKPYTRLQLMETIHEALESE